MKIAIDIRSACGRRAGKGHYTSSIVQALLKIDKKNKYILYSDKPSDEFKNIKRIEGRSILYHVNLLFRIVKDKPDIFFAPTSYIIPALAPNFLKVVMTVHDLVAFLFPDNHNEKAVFVEKLMLRKALKKAAGVACVSRNTQKDLYKIFGYPKIKTQIIYCAASDKFKTLNKEIAESVRTKCNLPDKFILGVGTIEPRKNFIRLIKAFNAVKRDVKDLNLVIVGERGWCCDEIYKLIKESDGVVALGYVKSEDLVKIYNLATMLVFPSIYEGFGIPPLEAMKCSCPVICSNTSSFPEVCGNAALTTDPHKEKGIENGIRKILNNKDFAENLVKRGLVQAQKFSWDRSAKKLLKIFTDIYEKNRNNRKRRSR